ncbi:hypothetical protein C8J27_106174 [Rhodobacter aestuarii]|uniref:Uncharacterized protein n=1 Tax=Rhodobacter aestuarii TaxID=453582 RepID=A0A1N7M7V0_9RHOB|nr:hypothetical protein [Rhodobacter aestuarii]PTV94905.1 hypothetical protein C8J27_106174 [Rhodobacter aestuarii]SIS82160.1 hypothetical protein SAMN05421580_105174 [Rhodobacter aestuarii]
MNGDIEQIHHIMRNLVRRIGGLDAYAAAFEAFTGKPQVISTISKKMSGSAEWWISDMLAAQHALGITTVSDRIDGMASVDAARRTRRAISILASVKEMSRECSEAAIASVEAHCEGTIEAHEAALKEVAEAREVTEATEQLLRINLELLEARK